MSNPVPHYKAIPGTNFTVDAFRYPSPYVKGYFLSHAHSDHYTGLRETWSHGPIYCSAVTAELVVHILGVDAEWLRPLALEQPVVIDGVEVTLVDANHCPGAVQFLFALPDGRKYVHTGDMRYCPAMGENPALQHFKGADVLYLDTTYCHPKHCFPPQEESIEYVSSTIHRLMQESVAQPLAAAPGTPQQQQQEGGGAGGSRPSRLFLISTYACTLCLFSAYAMRLCLVGVGKERILDAVVRRCGVRLHVTERKQRVMRCLELAGYPAEELFTTDEAETCVHVVQWGFLGDTWPFFRPNFVNMEAYRQEHGVDEVVGFVPTGWLHEMKKQTFSVRRKGALSVHLVPYSEHSSFTELQEYVSMMRPHKVVPTVGAGGQDAEKSAAKMVKHFRHLVDETASKAKFLSAFHRQGPVGAGTGAGNGAAAALAAAEAGGSMLGDCEPSGASLEGKGGETGEEGGEGEEPAGMGCGEGGGGIAPGQGEMWWLGRKRPREEDGQQGGEVISLLDSEEEGEPGGAEGKVPWPGRQQWQQGDSRGSTSAGAAAVAGIAASDDGPGRAPREQHLADPGTLNTGSAAAGTAATVVAEEAGAAAVADGPVLAQRLEGLAYIESVLGESLAQGQAGQLLQASGNDPQRAINMYLDGWKPRQAEASSGQAAAVAPARGGKAEATSSSADGAGGAGKAGGQRKGSAAAGGPKPKRQKAGGGAGAAAAPAGQRSILSFFGAGAASPLPPHPSSRPASPASMPAASGAGAVREVANAAEHSIRAPTLGRPKEGAAALAAAGVQQGGMGSTARFPRQQQEGEEVQKEAATGEGMMMALEVPAAAGAGLGVDGKPRLVLPPPPSPSTGPSAFFGGGKLAQQGAGDRADQVPKSAVALPLDQYDPVGHAAWEPGQPTPYLHLSRAFDAMDATTKRLSITDVLVNTFRSVLALAPQDLAATAYLATGTVAPEYEGMELNVGGSTVAGAVQEATGVSRARLREMYIQMGDIGDVAQACKRTQATLRRPAQLTVQGVLSTLRGLAAEKGQGSAARRQRSVLGLLRACRESETKYITRTLVQALRVRANWRSVIPALAKAVLIDREGVKMPKARLDAVGAAATAAFHVCPNLEKLVGALLEGPPEEVQSRCKLMPGIPIKPMLAKPGGGFGDAISQLKGAPFLAEYKYDGVRAQVHVLADGQVKIFSRHCEDRTASYPDVAQQVKDAAQGGAASLILDAELVAVERDPAGGEPRLRAFQELASRPRLDVSADSVSVAVCVYVFDLLYSDGASLLGLPLWQRRAALLQALPNMRPGYVALAQSQVIAPNGSLPLGMAVGAVAAPAAAAVSPAAAAAKIAAAIGSTAAAPISSTSGGVVLAGPALPEGDNEAAAPPEALATASPEELEEQLRQALLEAFAAGTEGLMLKGLAAAYEPSKRSESWVKLKKDYIQGLSDSLDLVPIGAWYGNGRKVGWLSPFLMAVWDPESEELQSICRCMSGFSDAFYKEATARLKEGIIPGPKNYYRTGEAPDVWFEPREVWEIRGADLTLSPVHKAALGRLHSDRGVGLRFPRFVRIREDKAPEDASSADAVVELYESQTRKVEHSGEALAARAAAGRARAPRQKEGQGPEAEVQEEGDSGGEEEEEGGWGGNRETRQLEL